MSTQSIDQIIFVSFNFLSRDNSIKASQQRAMARDHKESSTQKMMLRK